MEKRTLGKTGLQVSELGFGSAPAAFLKTQAAAAATMINTLLDRGINFIDTATMYPDSEAFIGEHLASRRSDYILTSKVGHRMPGSNAAPFTPELVAFAVDRALSLMKTDHIDVMLLHSCDLDTLKKGDALGALQTAKDAGKLKFIGYSGDNEAAAYAASLAQVDVIETSINFADQRNIELALPVCVKNNVGVIAKRPIGNACWKPIDAQPGFYKNYASEYTKRFAAMNLKPTELGFLGDPNEIWPEIALRFTLSQPGISTAIVGTTNPDNALRNIAIAEKGPLPEAVVNALRTAFHAADPDGKWVGQT